MIEIVFEEARWEAAGLQALAARAAKATLPVGDWEVAVLACDDERIAGLNAKFRSLCQREILVIFLLDIAQNAWVYQLQSSISQPTTMTF